MKKSFDLTYRREASFWSNLRGFWLSLCESYVLVLLVAFVLNHSLGGEDLKPAWLFAFMLTLVNFFEIGRMLTRTKA